MRNHELSLAGMGLAAGMIWAGIANAQAPTQATALNRADLLHSQGVAECARGRYGEAEQALRESLALQERLLPPGNPGIGVISGDLAAALHYQGRYAEAEPLYQRAIGILAGKPDYSAALANTTSNLASIYCEQARLTEAGALYSQIAAFLNDPSPADEMIFAAVTHQYGRYLEMTGDGKGAERAFLRAIEIRQRRLGSEHPATIPVWNSLGELYFERGELDRAEPVFRGMLGLCDRTPALISDPCMGSLNGLALVALHRGAYPESERLFARWLSTLEQASGATADALRRQRGAVLNNLGILADRRKSYKQAEKYFLRALETWTTQYGPAHPNLAAACSNLASTYLHRHQWSRAESFYRRALAIHEQQLGALHPTVATDLSNLGVLFVEMNRQREAAEYFERAIAVYERTGDAESPSAAVALVNLANLRCREKRCAEAIPLYRQVLRIFEHQAGNAEEPVAAALETYAILMRRSKEYAEAQKAEALATRMRVHAVVVRNRIQSSFQH